MTGFSHVSLLIELDHEWWPPKTAAFLSPANYFPRRARMLVHETMHYWQQLGSSYLLAMAQEDWEQLISWEQGARPAIGVLRGAYRRPEGLHHYSSHDLCECLARFWEVMFLSPRVVLRDAVIQARRASLEGVAPKELTDLAARAEGDGDEMNTQVFDMAMQLSGSYGIPFAVLRKVIGAGNATVLFPLLVHFALKTTRPVYYFERFVDRVTGAALARADELGIASSWDRAAAVALYTTVSSYCGEIIRETGDERRLSCAAIFGDSSLRDNPAYQWSFGQVDRLAKAIGGHDDIVDMAICLPAFSDFRILLTSYLAPPCVRFRDRQAVGLAAKYLSAHDDASAEDKAAAETAMDACLSLQQRWESFSNSSYLH
jgi:hypothetical protein